MSAARKLKQGQMLQHRSKAQIFNEVFFAGFSGIEWFNMSGVYTIDENRRAIITIKEYGHADHFAGYTVEIIHKLTGPITSQVFKFNSYFSEKDRNDGRNDPNGPHYYKCDSFHAWRNNGRFEWYIAVPSPNAVKQMCERIFEYINLWR